MERAISEMERIKRAQEISYKRRNENDSYKEESINIYKGLFKLVLIINLIIMIFAIKNSEYIFTSDFINQIKSYNVNLKSKIEEFLKYDEMVENSSTQTESNSQKNEQSVDNSRENQLESGVSGEKVENNSALVENTEEIIEEKELSQMEIDANKIKEKYSFILPVEGEKTSGFGIRESLNKIVTSNHTGVDIAAKTGTVIKSAIEGKVLQVSSQGDYGKHIRIINGDLVMLYAHCSKIYLNEGDSVAQGQNIGEVGTTGNSTGPHLHFEIKYQDRLVDPEMILKF